MANIVSISTLSAQDILQLEEHLEKFNVNKSATPFLVSHIGNFFIDLSFEDEVSMSYILEEKNELDLTNFIKTHSYINVDLTGTTKAKKQKTWKSKEYALLYRYYLISNKSNKTKKDLQILDAYNLTPLFKLDTIYTMEYIKLKLLYYPKEHLTNINKNISLKNKFDYEMFIRYLYTYYLMNKNTEFIDDFIKYVFYILDILRLDEESISQISQTYLSIIKELF